MAAQEDIMRNSKSLRSFAQSEKKTIIKEMASSVFDTRVEVSNFTGEEPPESLFMKELKRRGMTPTSLLEETNRGNYGVEDEMKIGEEDWGFSKRNSVSTEIDKGLSNQREKSMALNSEGLEGLIPRAKLLLTIGGAFFLGFWPLILIIVASFSALYSLASLILFVLCLVNLILVVDALERLKYALGQVSSTTEAMHQPRHHNMSIHMNCWKMKEYLK
ncbi:hypothetical protein POTOM_002250 [Populus tomentosa]|uniref:Uncharacterized protein n=1 Tax=Populus tomentosa TaxID=118781 RepID=A0A8X8IWM8_POPTO|nr:hypothetical protein POTOM_002250 [Populus tomentosa]